MFEILSPHDDTITEEQMEQNKKFVFGKPLGGTIESSLYIFLFSLLRGSEQRKLHFIYELSD